MSLSSDLNLLAANNIIGYDTCAQTLNGMGMGVKRSGYNPYGVGKLNTGVTCDTFTGSKTEKAVKTGIIGGVVLALASKISGAIGKEMPKGAKITKKKILKFFGLKAPRAAKAGAKNATKKVAQKGLKGFLSKAGKIGKGALILTGLGTIATGAFKLYKSTQVPVSDAPQTQQ